MPEELTEKSAAELVALMRARAVSPVEVAEAHLRRIEQLNPSLNAVVNIAGDVVDRARAAEQALMNRASVGSLHGLPVTIKDTIDVAGLATTAGSRVRAGYVPQTDAHAVARLKKAGAIILGKTNVPEMAIPYECDNPVFGRANNPRNPLMTPGGSSGGEAAAIASCLSPAGLGSDLSGSIRVPAHFCGIAGLKPTAGRVPMDGHTPEAAGVISLGASMGPMARRVGDLALLFDVLADPTQFERMEDHNRLPDSHQLGATRFVLHLDESIAPVAGEIAAALDSAARALTEAGLEIVNSEPPAVSAAAELWMDLFARAANNEIASLYRGREDEAGPAVAKILSSFPSAPAEFEDRVEAAEQLSRAVLKREQLREELLAWMKLTPLILTPAGATAAFEHGTTRVDVDGKSISVFRAFGYSRAFNVLGLPAVSVPAGRTPKGLPVGVQIVGRPFEEKLVLAAAAIVESALGGWQPRRF